MAFLDSLGGVGASAVGWMTTTAFWVFLMVAICIFSALILWIRKRRRMNKVVLEHYDLGDGRFDYRLTKGGWFKERFTLAGLWDYGNEDRFRLKDMTPVDNVSHNDYRMFNGKQCISVVRNPNDPKMVFPISRFYLSKNSRAIMAEVAPADFRDSAQKSIEQTDLEMTSKWQQYAPLIITGLVIIIALIITLLNTQYGKYMVDKATETILILKDTPCQAIPSPAGVAP